MRSSSPDRCRSSSRRPLSFINTGSDLVYAAAELFRLHGEERALGWAGNLVSRYVQIRHPRTGLGAYQFNHREPCRVRESFKPPLGDRTRRQRGDGPSPRGRSSPAASGRRSPS